MSGVECDQRADNWKIDTQLVLSAKSQLEGEEKTHKPQAEFEVAAYG